MKKLKILSATLMLSFVCILVYALNMRPTPGCPPFTSVECSAGNTEPIEVNYGDMVNFTVKFSIREDVENAVYEIYLRIYGIDKLFWDGDLNNVLRADSKLPQSAGSELTADIEIPIASYLPATTMTVIIKIRDKDSGNMLAGGEADMQIKSF